MDLEEETGSLSGAVPEGASVSGRVKTLCWARVNVACSGDAPVPVRPPAGRGCRPPPTDAAEAGRRVSPVGPGRQRQAAAAREVQVSTPRAASKGEQRPFQLRRRLRPRRLPPSRGCRVSCAPAELRSAIADPP